MHLASQAQRHYLLSMKALLPPISRGGESSLLVHGPVDFPHLQQLGPITDCVWLQNRSYFLITREILYMQPLSSPILPAGSVQGSAGAVYFILFTVPKKNGVSTILDPKALNCFVQRQK